MSEKEGKAPVTLEMALKEGLVISKEEMDRILKEEMKKHEKSLKKKLLKEVQADMAKASTQVQEANLERMLDGTGLTSLEFTKKLHQMNVPVRYWKCLRDEHINFTPTQVWDYIRANDTPAIRQSNQWA